MISTEFYYVEGFFILECQQRNRRPMKAGYRGQLFILLYFLKGNDMFDRIESQFNLAKSSVAELLNDTIVIYLVVIRQFFMNIFQIDKREICLKVS